MRIDITEKELRGMKYIGKGNFGKVYTDGINVIKVWNKQCRTDILSLVDNPCYKLDRKNSRKFKRLNKRSNNLVFSDIRVDEVYLDSKYIGIKKKYAEGITLNKLVYLSLEEKKTILLKLIRNIEELINNNIYTLDCKMDNIIVTKNMEVKLIDLNDFFTKVSLISNPLYKKKCLNLLKKTILNYLYYNQYDFYESSRELTSINKDIIGKNNLTIQELKEFVNDVNMSENIFIINIDDIEKIDINILKEYLVNNNLKLVLTIYDKILYDNLFVRSVRYLNKCGIEVYDMILCKENIDKVDCYIKSHDSKSVYFYKDNNLIYREYDREINYKYR